MKGLTTRAIPDDPPFTIATLGSSKLSGKSEHHVEPALEYLGISQILSGV